MATQEKATWLPSLDILSGWQWRALGIFLFFAGWTIAAWNFPMNLMPMPQEAFALMWGLVQSGAVWANLSATLAAMFWGFLAGLILGVQMGVFMGIDAYQRKFLTPHVILNLSIPHVSWAILATLIFGFDILAPIVATALTVFPFVAISVWKGVENLDRDLLEMAKTFDLSLSQTLRRVIFPNIAPSLFSASRLGLAMSWKTVTIAEMFASNEGIGYQIITAYQDIRFHDTWAWALVFIVVILVIEYGIFKQLQKKVFDYRPDADFRLLG